jgi:hypothetical protein
MRSFRFRSSALDGCNFYLHHILIYGYEDMLMWAALVHTFSLGVVAMDRQTDPIRLRVMGGKVSLCFNCWRGPVKPALLLLLVYCTVALDYLYSTH